MIRGVGVDMVYVPRFKAACDKYGTRLLDRLFTGPELEYCMKQRFPARHLAARFAAKVSLVKALGASPGFKKIEVARGPSGSPFFRVAGAAEGLKLSLAISHTGDLSIAHTLVEEA